MGLSQQEIDALKAEDAQLAALQGAAQPAQRVMTFPPAGGAYPDDTPSAQALAPYINPSASPAGQVSDSGGLPQIQVGENVTRKLGGPDQQQAPAPTSQPPAALTPEQVAALKAEDAQLAEQEAKTPAPKEESKLSKAWDFVKEKIDPTKEEKDGGVINPDLEKLPDWTLMAQPIDHPINTLRAMVGTLISNIDETKDVIKEQFPDAKVEKKGAYLVITQPDGQRYSWKPGMRYSDWARAAMTIPVAAPVGGAAAAGAALLGAPAAIAGAVGTLGSAAYLEKLKSDTGGGFNKGNIAAALAFHGLLNGVHTQVPTNVGPEAAGALVGAEGAAIQPAAAALVAPVDPQMSQPELAGKMSAAARGSSSAGKSAIGQMRIDPELAAAARKLPSLDGLPLVESLAPEHLSRNPNFRRLAAAATGSAEGATAAKKGLGATWNQLLDVAGAPGNQGALETSAKEAISRRLEAAQRLVDEIYSTIDGADAVAASETRAGKPAVTGLVARSAPAPVPEFNAVIERARSDLGTLPKSVEKFRAELFSGASVPPVEPAPPIGYATKMQMVQDRATVGEFPQKGESLDKFLRIGEYAEKPAAGLGVPTRAMVNRMRMAVGRDIGAGGKKFGIGLAHDMYNALDAAYLASAEQSAPEAAALIRSGKTASQYLRGARDLTTSVLGMEAERSLTDRVASEVANLPYGNTATFAKVMSVAPDAMKPELAQHALRQFVDRAKSLNVQELNDWFKAMQGNKPSWNALKRYIGEDLAKNLESTAKISANVEAAMNAVKARQPFTEPWNIPGLVTKGLKLLGINKYGGPIAGTVYTISDKILAAPGPLNDAVGEWLASPAVRDFMTAEAKGAVSPGMIRSMMQNLSFRKVAHLANIPVHSRQAFLAATNEQQQEAPAQ